MVFAKGPKHIAEGDWSIFRLSEVTGRVFQWHERFQHLAGQAAVWRRETCLSVFSISPTSFGKTPVSPAFVSTPKENPSALGIEEEDTATHPSWNHQHLDSLEGILSLAPLFGLLSSSTPAPAFLSRSTLPKSQPEWEIVLQCFQCLILALQ